MGDMPFALYGPDMYQVLLQPLYSYILLIRSSARSLTHSLTHSRTHALCTDTMLDTDVQ